MIDIRAYIKENGPLLFDGAMGTCFAARPGRADQRCELANLTAPDEIAAIHRAYLDAGCRAVVGGQGLQQEMPHPLGQE